MRKAALALSLGFALHLHAAYHVVRHIPIGGTGGWDYLTVDSASKRLFVSHGDRVEVIDIATGKAAGAITGLSGVHGIAIAPELGRGYISSGRSNGVTIFALKDLSTIKEVKATGDNPDTILYEPLTKRVWTFNGRGKNATVFDSDGAVLETLPLGGKPEAAVSDRRGHIFVNVEDTSELAVIDAKAMQVQNRFPLAPCESPSGLALDRDRARLFSVCDNKMMAIIDDATGKVVTTAAIGGGVDGAAANNKARLAFSSNGADGTITVVDTKNGKVVGTIETARGARTIAIDEKTGHLFVSTAKLENVEGQRRPRAVEGTFEVIELAP